MPTPTGAAATNAAPAYARTLTEMAARRRAFLPGMAQMSCGDRSLLRRRVRAVLEPPPHRRSIPLGALFLLIAALCAMLVLPLHSGGTRVTENTLLSFLHAPVRETAFFPAGLYGAAEVRSGGEGETAVLRLSYASPQDLAPGARPPRSRPHRPPRPAAASGCGDDRLADGGRGTAT